MPVYDIAIIGGGPAGLTAALYLARLNRKALVIERGGGQTAGNQITDNFPGFPKGIPSKELVAKAAMQARRFGAVLHKGEVTAIRKRGGRFLLSGALRCSAKGVIICTGVSPAFPPFPGHEKYVGRSLFDCLICHGYAVSDRVVVVVGHDDATVLTCLQLRRFTRRIVLLTNCDAGTDKLSGAGRQRLRRCRIRMVCGAIKAVRGRGGLMRKVELDTGVNLDAEFMFSRQDRRPDARLAASLGAVIDGEGYIKVDIAQRTSVPMLFAAGDICHASNHQLITAAHQGAVAAVSANEDLSGPMEKPW